MINYQIKIEKEAQHLTRETPDEVIRYMVQSLSVNSLNHINFLINLWAEYNTFGKLNDAQLEALISFGKEFDIEMNKFKETQKDTLESWESRVTKRFLAMRDKNNGGGQ